MVPGSPEPPSGEPTRGRRDLALAALAALALPAAGLASPDRALALAWAGLVALPAGIPLGAALAAGRGARLLVLAPLAGVLVLPRLALAVPDPWAAGQVLLALVLLGAALGRARPRAWAGDCAAALLLGGLLAALPSLGGLAGPAPWSPAVAARLLDLAPTTWIPEVAGLDWMRHGRIYAPAGTSSIGPELRQAVEPGLAARIALLVSCGIAFLLAGRGRAPRAPVSARRVPPSP